MQRWIVAGLVAMMLFLGGGYFAYRTIKRNRPQPIWVPVPINPQLPTAKRDEIIKKVMQQLSDPYILEKVSHDLNLTRKMDLPTDRDVAAELGKQLFVRPGDMDTPMGKVPSIHIGLTGKAKDTALTGEIAIRLMDDAWPILGISPPKKSKTF